MKSISINTTNKLSTRKETVKLLGADDLLKIRKKLENLMETYLGVAVYLSDSCLRDLFEVKSKLEDLSPKMKFYDGTIKAKIMAAEKATKRKKQFREWRKHLKKQFN